MQGPAYLERVAVNTPANVVKAKKAIKRAFQVQVDSLGFSLVEVLSQCPTDWTMTPLQAIQKVKDEMIPYYPLGVFKSPDQKDEEK